MKQPPCHVWFNDKSTLQVDAFFNWCVVCGALRREVESVSTTTQPTTQPGVTA